MAKYTDKKKESNRRWDATNLDRISIALPKGRKADLQAVATRHGQSVNGYINSLIDDALGGKQSEEAGGGFGFSAPVDSDIVYSRFLSHIGPSFSTAVSASGQSPEEYILQAVRERIEREQER